MLTNPTIEKLQALRLMAMAEAFDQQRSSSQYAEHRPRFPHVLGRRTDRAAHNAPQAVNVTVFRVVGPFA